MKFFYKEAEKKTQSGLTYDEDGSLLYPLAVGSSTSILINDLELGFDDTDQKVTSVSGWCPLGRYTKTNLFPKKYDYYDLFVNMGKEYEYGVSYRYNPNYWPIQINKAQVWVCLGILQTEGYKLIEFLPGCVATFDGEDLIALWLHPKDLPDYIYEDP